MRSVRDGDVVLRGQKASLTFEARFLLCFWVYFYMEEPRPSVTEGRPVLLHSAASRGASSGCCPGSTAAHNGFQFCWLRNCVGVFPWLLSLSFALVLTGD